MATPDLTALKADGERIKLEGLQIISTGIDAAFGVAQQEVVALTADLQAFIANYLSANLSGPAASFLAMGLGIVSPLIKSLATSIDASIAAELSTLQHTVDNVLASVEK